MAEPWNRAFGRYLRTLRTRCGYSLDDVLSLSQAFPEKLNKAYMSRVENGINRLALSKVIALSRIYDIPSEVLLERMELDLEVERVGGPDTAGMSFEELSEEGRKLINEGYKLRAYAMYRDAIALAESDPVQSILTDHVEQYLVSQMRCATAALAAGRTRFPLHEFRYIGSADGLSPRYSSIVFERIATCYRKLGEIQRARDAADESIRRGLATNDNYALGHAYNTRAHILIDTSTPQPAVEDYQRGFDCFRRAGLESGCALTLVNIAQAYFDLGRLGASRRSLEAADRIVTAKSLYRTNALAKVLLGQIEEIHGHDDMAVALWREAIELARHLDDKALRFRAEFVLFKHASEHGHKTTARVLERRLRRLRPWLPEDTPELRDFNKIVPTRSSTKPRSRTAT